MKTSAKHIILTALLAPLIVLSAPIKSVVAQDVPGSADAGRIEIDPQRLLPPRQDRGLILPQSAAPEALIPPEGADAINFVLEDVAITGMSAFSQEEMVDIYRPYIGQEIPLSMVWAFAQEITARYQAEGYFLSRAYVPAQEIEDGIITIGVIEGYIGDINVEGENADNYLVNALRQQIGAQRPTRLDYLENKLLLLNDIPGVYYQAILEKMDADAPEGAVRLLLKEVETKGRGSVVFNNHGSRFIGPHRASFAYEDSLIPLQNTSVYGLASVPGGDELWAVGISHEVKITPALGVEFSLANTISDPGYTLADDDIESHSIDWGVELSWQIIRQRLQNLELSLALDGRNVKTDILDTPLTRDNVRALRVGAVYDGVDEFIGGYNVLDVRLSRGITGLGANNPGELYLSRADAKPDFTKLETTWQHSQYVSQEWLALTTLSGQYASKPLYSSEEFGVGGSSLGRAYDESEITGDHGIAASIEMQYTAIEPIENFKLTPSVFYDFGKVWNINSAQNDGVSIVDAGIGLDVSHPSGFNASFSIAQPLTRAVDNPIYGSNGHNPRIYFQVGWQF